MKPSELVRAIVIILLGIGLMLGLQPWLFASGTIFLEDVELQEWVPSYAVGTYLVLGTTLLVTIIWLLLTSLVKPSGGVVDVPLWRVWWFVLHLFPIVAICVALYYFNPSRQDPSQDALLWLALFYPLDVLWMYWLTTVTSTPKQFLYVPPLGLIIRKILDG